MTVLLVPLDDCPVTRLVPAMAAAAAWIEVVAPPVDLVGTRGQPGDPAALAAWLREEDNVSAGAGDACAKRHKRKEMDDALAHSRVQGHLCL